MAEGGEKARCALFSTGYWAEFQQPPTHPPAHRQYRKLPQIEHFQYASA